MDFESGRATTTTRVSETHVNTELSKPDISYIKTIPGMLKVAQEILNFIGFICIMCSGPYYRGISTGQWFTFVCMTAFWTTGILLAMYLVHFMEKFHVIPWMLIEMCYTMLWTFFYFTAALDVAVNARWDAAYGAAAFFGFFAMLTYACDAFLKFKGWRAGQLVQGEKVEQNNVTQEPRPPAY